MSVAGRDQGKVAWPVTRRFCNDVVVDPIYRPGVIPDPAELSDGQVLLRTWSQDDLGCIEAASLDPVIPGGTTVPSVFSEEAGRAFVARQWGRWTSGEQGSGHSVRQAGSVDPLTWPFVATGTMLLAQGAF